MANRKNKSTAQYRKQMRRIKDQKKSIQAEKQDKFLAKYNKMTPAQKHQYWYKRTASLNKRHIKKSDEYNRTHKEKEKELQLRSYLKGFNKNYARLVNPKGQNDFDNERKLIKQRRAELKAQSKEKKSAQKGDN